MTAFSSLYGYERDFIIVLSNLAIAIVGYLINCTIRA